MSVETEKLYSNNAYFVGGPLAMKDAEITAGYVEGGRRSNNDSPKGSKKVKFSEKDQIKKIPVGSISQTKSKTTSDGSNRRSSFRAYGVDEKQEETDSSDNSARSSPGEITKPINSRHSASPHPKSPVKQSVFHASSSFSPDTSVLLKSEAKAQQNASSAESPRQEKFSFHAKQSSVDKKDKEVIEELGKSPRKQYARSKENVLPTSSNNVDIPQEGGRKSIDTRILPSPKWRKAASPENPKKTDIDKSKKEADVDTTRQRKSISLDDDNPPTKHSPANSSSVFHAGSKTSPDSNILITNKNNSPSSNGRKQQSAHSRKKSSPNEELNFQFRANGHSEVDSDHEVMEEKILPEIPTKREITIVLPDPNGQDSPKERKLIPLGRSNTLETPKPILKKAREATYDVIKTKDDQGNDASKDGKRITDDSSSKSRKKTEPLSLPPAKQNGSLVTSGDVDAHHKRDKNNNETTTKKATEKRQNSDPSKKTVAEETPRQARSAPTKNRKAETEAEVTPRFNNYTNGKNDVDTSGTSKQKAEKDKRNNRKLTTTEIKSKTENPANFSPTKDDKASTYSRSSNHTNHSNKQSVSTVGKQTASTSLPTQKSNKDSDKGNVSPDKKSQENEKTKHENKILDLEKIVKTPRSKTPATARSTTPKTPRAKTPSYLIRPHKVRYGVSRLKKTEHKKSDGDTTPRTPEPRRSILSNKDAVRLERTPTSHSRPKSFKWERDKSIYRSHTRDWENETVEMTHRPSVNSPTDWLRVYVGEIDLRGALRPSKSRRDMREGSEEEHDQTRKHKPGYPYRYAKEYILSRQQVQPYRNMKTVYGDSKVKEKQHRQKQFFSKLQEFQIMKAKLRIEEMQEKEKKKEETRRRQQKQLKELRQRFEDAAWVRFNSQYVTSRVLEHEKMNRYEYGLPEEIDGEAEFAAKLKRKPVKTKLDLGKMEKKNKEVYGSIFNIYKGPSLTRNMKTPPMEGIDTVTIEYEDDNGHKVERTRRVKDVINDAKREMDHLKATNTNTGMTPRETQQEKVKVEDSKTYATNLSDDESDDDDDDMSDIFERARRKYNLEVDDDEDSRSRR